MHACGAFIGERFLLVGVVFLKLIVASGMAKGRYFQGKRYPIVLVLLFVRFPLAGGSPGVTDTLAYANQFQLDTVLVRRPKTRTNSRNSAHTLHHRPRAPPYLRLWLPVCHSPKVPTLRTW